MSSNMACRKIFHLVRSFASHKPIEFGDFPAARHVLEHRRPLRSNIQDLFRSVDADGDGTVNLEEQLGKCNWTGTYAGMHGKPGLLYNVYHGLFWGMHKGYHSTSI